MRGIVVWGLLALFSSPAVMAQTGPGGPGGPHPGPAGVTCQGVHGGLLLTSISTTAIEGTLAGDLAGDLSLTVNSFVEHTNGPVTRRRSVVSGTITTATGTLQVSGHVLTVESAGGPIPFLGGPMALPAFTRARIHLVVTGGTGDFDTVQAGRIHAGYRAFPGAMVQGGHYRGRLCSPAMPAPTP